MPDARELASYYESLTDGELLILVNERGFTEEAGQVIAAELNRRHLKPEDKDRYLVPERIRLRDELQKQGFRNGGPGLLFFGRSYLNEDDRKANIQVRTRWFCLGGVPLIPIASYRFKIRGEPRKSVLRNWLLDDPEQRVIERVPLNWRQVCSTWIKTAIYLIVVGLLLVGFIWYFDRA